MSVPYTVARKTVVQTLRKISENKNFQNQLFAFSAQVAKYLGYEDQEMPDRPLPPPSLDPSVSRRESTTVSPSVKKPLDDVIRKINENTVVSNRNMESLFNAMDSVVESMATKTQSDFDKVQDSDFMSNNILVRDTLQSMSLNLEAHTIMLGALWETLEKNLSTIAAIKMVDSQNNKVNLDKQALMAERMDYGDFFYQFIPTSEYWARVDQAYIARETRLGLQVNPSLYPSLFYAADEIELIDSLESDYPKSYIRQKVEEYRKNSVSSSLRALIGQVAVDQARDQAETNSKARAYYETATESLLEKEVPQSLDALTTAVTPIARWAERAKVREDFLMTPRPVVRDINGVEVAVGVSPLEVVLAKDIALAKGEADTNSIGAETIDILDDLFEDMDIDINMFKRYVRVDEMLEKAKDFSESGSENWDSIMEGLYR